MSATSYQPAVCAVEDIAIEGSDPVDVSGHFSDLFVGVYRKTTKVALKRVRIGSHPSQDDARKIEVSILCVLHYEVLI